MERPLPTSGPAHDGRRLQFNPPQEGVHNVPKWLPTVPCLEAMLRFVGYEVLESLPPVSKNRVIYMCRRWAWNGIDPEGSGSIPL